jgi:Peptidase family M28/PA domain
MRRLTIVAVVLLTALLAATPAQAIDEINTKRLRNAVTVNGILGHERVFQRIANQNGGTRASGTPGYDASVAYVADRLEAAGYDAVIIFNEGNPGREELFIGTLGTPFTIPVVGLSFADAAAVIAQIQAGAEVVVRVETLTEIDPNRTTTNILADSPTGSDDRVVVVGAHLDSVIAGPGINDNGSGSSTILEIAEEMAELGITNRQQLRFAFWGAEELGLLGSEHYVNSLSDAEVGSIYANLNFDMVGSPNYVRFVYDGDGSDTETAGPPGSAQIEAIFNQYFAGQGLASEPTAFDGRSDYGPFIAVGIPAGGLFTGAEGIKTPDQAAVYGGTAGIAYDPCYHQACDTINNLSTKALAEMGDATAHATMTLARTRSGFFEDGSRVARTRVATAEQGPQAAA